jgi:hypothetical protein
LNEIAPPRQLRRSTAFFLILKERLPHMNFISYNVALLVACIAAFLIFSLAPLLLYAYSKLPQIPIVILVLSVLAGLCLFYLVGGLSALSVTMAYKFANKPEVTWHFPYFIAGFIWCFLSTAFWWMTLRRVSRKNDLLQKFFVFFGGNVTLVAIPSYILFAIWPGLTRILYGWLSTLTWYG